jgi:hypothetical protein
MCVVPEAEPLLAGVAWRAVPFAASLGNGRRHYTESFVSLADSLASMSLMVVNSVKLNIDPVVLL